MNESDDVIEKIIACSLEDDVDSPTEWVGRHQSQAKGEVDVDRVKISGGDAFCVAYTPGVDLDIIYPEDQAWGDDLRETLKDKLLTGTFAGVSFPVRTGCDRIWKRETDLPIFDSELPWFSPGGSPYHMASTTICITPEDWLRFQFSLTTADNTQKKFSQWLSQVSDKQLSKIEDAIASGTPTDWPRPYIELDTNGEVVPSQEGRHRGIAAYNQDVPYMDVFVFANNDSTKGRPEYKYPTPPQFPEKEF